MENRWELMDIKTKDMPAAFDSKALPGLMGALTPLECIRDLVGKICYYRHQIKVLETEQVRIAKEAELAHHKIDAALEVYLKVLEERRMAIGGYIKAVSDDLAGARIEKEKLTEAISNLGYKISDKNYSLEEKKIFYDSIVTLTELLKKMSSDNVAKLTLLAENTKKALENLSDSPELLTFSK